MKTDPYYIEKYKKLQRILHFKRKDFYTTTNTLQNCKIYTEKDILLEKLIFLEDDMKLLDKEIRDCVDYFSREDCTPENLDSPNIYTDEEYDFTPELFPYYFEEINRDSLVNSFLNFFFENIRTAKFEVDYLYLKKQVIRESQEFIEIIEDVLRVLDFWKGKEDEEALGIIIKSIYDFNY